MSSYVSYETIVEEEALDFIDEQRDSIIEGIKDDRDFDRNDIDGLDRAWHENITDRAYSPSDARFIIDESRRVEDDKGLWEGQEPDQALQTQAAYTFSNDVWASAEELYNEIKEEVDDRANELEIDDRADLVAGDKTMRRKLVSSDAFSVEAVFDEEENFLHVLVTSEDRPTVAIDDAQNEAFATLSPEVVALVKVVLDEAGEPADRELNEAFRVAVAKVEIDALLDRKAPPQIEPGSDEERRELQRFLRAGRDSSRSGYSLGHAYIDSRSGYMYGTSEFAFVRMDNRLSKQLPHLNGKDRHQLKAYWLETFGGPTPTNADEMLDKLARMIREGADSNELYDILPEIEAIREQAPGTGPKV